MDAEFRQAFAHIRDELRRRITHKLRATSLAMSDEDIDKIQNLIVWMTIDAALQEMLLVSALDPAAWESLEPDLPKIRQVFRDEPEFSRTALARLREATIQRRLEDGTARDE
jgi:hypothetical protein